MRDRNLAGRAREIGEIVLANLRSLQLDVAIIGDVRGRGAMLAMELVVPGTKDPNAAAAKAIVELLQPARASSPWRVAPTAT